MPRLFEPEQTLGNVPSARSGRPIATYDTTAIGAGMASMGNSIARAGAAVSANWDDLEKDRVASEFQKFKFEQIKAYDAEVRGLDPANARGFSERLTAEESAFMTASKAFYASVPDNLKPDYDAKLEGLYQSTYLDALDVERGFQKTFALQQLDDSLNTAILPKATMAAELPSGSARKEALLNEALAEAEQAINANPALTPAQKMDRLRATRESIESAFASALPPEERALVDPSRPVETIAERIAAIESGGRTDARNGNVVGLHQWKPGTWLGLVRTHRPDLAEGKSDKEILALREDPQVSAYFANVYLRENADRLQRAGQDASPGNLYLAHFLGPNGAVAMLDADPGLPADQVNPGAAKANPIVFYHKGDNGQPDRKMPKTVGEIVNWAHGKMGSSAVVTDWGRRLTNIPYDQKIAIAQDGMAALVRQDTAARQAQADAYDAAVNQRELAVEAGEYGLADWRKDFGDGFYTDAADAKRVRDRIQSLQKEGLALADVAAKYDGGYRFNAFDGDDRKAIDLLYDKGNAKGGEGLLEGDAGAALRLRAMVDRSDIIPTSAVDLLQSGIWSRTGSERDTAMTVLDGLYRENPQAVMRSFTNDDIARLQDYQALAGILPPEELDKRLNPNVDQRELDRRKALRSEGLAIAGKIKDGDILNSAFDPSILPFDQADAHPDPGVWMELRSDFANLFAERYAATGNEKVAKDQAIERLHMKWGMSEAGSGKYVMAYPPEQSYPQFNNSHDWLDAQLEEEVLKAYPDAQSWFLIPTPETEAAITFNRTGQGYEAVPYAVGVKDKEGGIRVLTKPDSAAWRIMSFDILRAREDMMRELEANRPKPIPESNPDMPGLDQTLGAIREKAQRLQGGPDNATSAGTMAGGAVPLQ